MIPGLGMALPKFFSNTEALPYLPGGGPSAHLPTMEKISNCRSIVFIFAIRCKPGYRFVRF